MADVLDNLLINDVKFKKYYDRVYNLLYVKYTVNDTCLSCIYEKPKDYSVKNVAKLYKRRRDIDYLEQVYGTTVTQFLGVAFYYPPITYFQDFYDRIQILIDKFDLSPFNNKLKMSADEIVNGYSLYDMEGPPIMRKERFDELLELWVDDPCTFEDFHDEYDYTACTDWNKLDPDGDFNYTDTDTECNRMSNCKKLYELPYPKKFIMETVTMGCANRMECVRYSNCLGEWMKRKFAQVNRVPSLKRMCIDVVKRNDLEYTALPKDLHQYFDKRSGSAITSSTCLLRKGSGIFVTDVNVDDVLKLICPWEDIEKNITDPT